MINFQDIRDIRPHIPEFVKGIVVPGTYFCASPTEDKIHLLAFITIGYLATCTLFYLADLAGEGISSLLGRPVQGVNPLDHFIPTGVFDFFTKFMIAQSLFHKRGYTPQMYENHVMDRKFSQDGKEAAMMVDALLG